MDIQEYVGGFIAIFLIIVLFGAFIQIITPMGLFPTIVFTVATLALIGAAIYSLFRK